MLSKRKADIAQWALNECSAEFARRASSAMLGGISDVLKLIFKIDHDALLMPTTVSLYLGFLETGKNYLKGDIYGSRCITHLPERFLLCKCFILSITIVSYPQLTATAWTPHIRMRVKATKGVHYQK